MLDNGEEQELIIHNFLFFLHIINHHDVKQCLILKLKDAHTFNG